MTPVCVAITSFLCVAQPYHQAVQKMSIEPPPRYKTFSFDAAVARQLGVKVTVIVVDVLQEYPTKAFDRTCAAADCLVYRKNCNDVAKKCAYSIGYPGTKPDVVTPDYLYIEYGDKQALAAAEKALFLSAGPKEQQSYIPLSALKIATEPEPQPLNGR